MAEVYVVIRSQDNVAMSSVNGEIIVVLVAVDYQILAQSSVSLTSASVVFRDVPAGSYSIVSRHPDLIPTEARYDTDITEKSILGIRFIYNEVARQLINIETEVRLLP